MRRHAITLRVRFAETDAMGVANNAVHLQYFEIGRIEHLRAMGHSYAELHDGGTDIVVVEAGIRYHAPLRFDDEVTVETTLEQHGRASIRFAYRLTAGGTLRAEGFTHHACVDRATMRPTRLPPWLAESA